MKTIFTCIVALFTSYMINAQIAGLDTSESYTLHSVQTSESTTRISPSELKDQHNKEFIVQVSEFIENHISYPAELRDYGIEGTVMVKLMIDNEGNIKNHRITKSLHEKFDSIVHMQFENFTKIEFTGKAYHGNHMINVPVNFTIDQ